MSRENVWLNIEATVENIRPYMTDAQRAIELQILYELGHEMCLLREAIERLSMK